MPGLAICAIFKDEAPFLLEWIAYHMAVGFDRFVLYDNDSSDNGVALVRASPLADRVTIIHWPQRPGQLSAYRHFIDIFAPEFDWAAFIDLDEFILPLNTRSVADTVQRLAHASAILMHWRVFGPSGHTERPPGLVIENYVRRAPDDFDMNTHVKSLVRCADLVDVTQNPHEFVVRGQAVNTAGQPAPNIAIQAAACHDELVVNHYHTRSRQDWQAKVARGNATSDELEPAYDAALIEHFAAICLVEDRTIQAFAPQVRALLGESADAAARSPPPPEPQPQQPAEPPILLGPIDAAPGWTWCGPTAQQHASALVYCDMSRPQHPWVAALRNTRPGSVDPEFLLDDNGRICDFTSDAAARRACEAALSG